MSTLTHTAPSWRPLARPVVLRFVIATEASRTQALLRLMLAAVLLPHGAQHLFGAFGGYGFTATVGWMSGSLGIPEPLAIAGILLEFVGPLLLIAGIASRLVGFALAIFMATAGSTHVANGFFMNWLGNLPAGVEGFEYHLLAIGIAIAIAANGAGSYSVDRMLDREGSPAGGWRVMTGVHGLRTLMVLLVVAPAAACSGATAPQPARADFVIEVEGERLVIRLTDPEAIARAEDNLRGRNAMFPAGPLREGNGGFNAPWSWHFDPAQTRFVEAAVEVCDGRPSYVETHRSDYPTYCPWGAKVVARRR